MDTKHITTEEFSIKIMNEPVYFYNDFENAVVKARRVEDKIEYFIKLSGKLEFKAVPGSRLVMDTLMDGMEISRISYDLF